MSVAHPFDRAIDLKPVGEGRFVGATAAAYANMVGPYGGVTAATMLRAVLLHPMLLGEPLALTVNFAAAVADGPFEVEALPVRTNRSTQHWVLTLTQKDAQGQPATVVTATAVTAARRETWGVDDEAMPTVPSPEDTEPYRYDMPLEWVRRYEMRPVLGRPPTAWEGQEDDSLSRLWVRDQEPRGLDFANLTAMADVFFPRIWLRRAVQTPAGTVSMTVYFHAGSTQMADAGHAWLLAQARAQAFRRGFFDQTAQLWTRDGHLLATSHQVVYFKA